VTRKKQLELPVSNSLTVAVAAEKDGRLENHRGVLQDAMRRHGCRALAAVDHLEREAKARGAPIGEQTMLLLHVAAVQIDNGKGGR
jgi:hypothetical protein